MKANEANKSVCGSPQQHKSNAHSAQDLPKLVWSCREPEYF